MEIITKAIKTTTWADIKNDVQIGTEKERIRSGDLLSFTLKNKEVVAVKVSYDQNGRLFFVLDNCLRNECCMNTSATSVGGWANCKMRQYLNETVFALLPDELQSVIPFTRIIQIVNGKRIETNDKLFLLSMTQVFGKSYWTEHEPEDTQLDSFLHERDRVKEGADHFTSQWWLRSVCKTDSFFIAESSGYGSSSRANNSYGIVFGFRLS